MQETGEHELNIKNTMASIDPEKHFVAVKLHPDEDQSAPLYRKYKTDSMGIYKKDTDMLELMRASDIIVIKMSTAGVEASIMGKDIILLGFHNTENLSPLAEYGFPIATTAEQMKKLLENPDCSDVRKRFLEDNVANLGNASEKVAGLI